MVMLPRTVATLALLEVSVKVIAEGAGPDRVTVSVPEPVVPIMVNGFGVNVSVSATVTLDVALV
jgi:hypothetical protein